jgi:hypothetical protein
LARQEWLQDNRPEIVWWSGALNDGRYWEFGEEWLDAFTRSHPRYLKTMRLLPRRRGRQAGEPHAGDLTELNKLQLTRAYQFEDALFAKLKSFRLSAADKEAVREFAAACAGITLAQMDATRPNRARTLGYRKSHRKSHIL